VSECEFSEVTEEANDDFARKADSN